MPTMKEAQPSAPLTCTNCHKVDGEGIQLRDCASCRSVSYCSRDCQRADWKEHKKTCSFTPSSSSRSARSGGASSSTAGPESGGSTNTAFNFLRGHFMAGRSRWLDDSLPEDQIYGYLIDSWRMRVEDEYNFQCVNQGLYANEDPVPGFRNYLAKAERKQGVLPSWWSAEKRDKCVAKGSSREGWSSLHFAVEKSDTQEHYHDSTMPMQLRVLAEEIIGTNVMSM